MTEELAAGLKRTKEAVAASQAFYRLHKSSVSTPNAVGKCVTAGETAPLELTAENMAMLLRSNPKDARLGFMPTAVVIDPNQWAFDNGLEST